MIPSLDELDEPSNRELYLHRKSQRTSGFRKHLAGQHDQSTHGRRGGVVSGLPKDEQRAKEKAVWELHETGKTWEQVAKELGYANGGAARKAGMRHKERLDREGEKDTAKPEPSKPEPSKPEPSKPVSGTPKERIEQLRQQALGDQDLASALNGAANGSQLFDLAPTDAETEIITKLTEAGNIARAEINRRLELKMSPQTRALKAEVEALKDDGKYNEKRTLLHQRLEKEVGSTRPEVIKEVVSEMTGRTFGTTKVEFAGDQLLAKPLSLTMQKLFPSVWATAGNPNEAAVGRVNVKFDKRAYWQSGTKTIGMSSGDVHVRRTMASALHELTHLAETNRSGLRHAEFVFWHMRAKGEKVKSFNALEGFGSKREFTVGDKWRNKYSGRVYSYDKKPRRKDPYEILSTGMESLYYGARSNASALIDDEHAAFTLAMVMFG